ncbi:hypothetical protein, partial [Helicobacter pullorum]|uniref:hypothetical protein n=1 Tax=Helicobacter pullorum TaxID=35818 RepID=UPI001DDE0188
MASALASNAVAVDNWIIKGVYYHNSTQSNGNTVIRGQYGGGNLGYKNYVYLDIGNSFRAKADSTVGNFTINENVAILMSPNAPSGSISFNRMLRLEDRAKAGTIDNQGTILVNSANHAANGVGIYLDVGNNATLDTFTNSGLMRNETGGGSGKEMLVVWRDATINNLINKGTIYGQTGVIHSKGGTIKNMLFSGPNSITEAGDGNVINIINTSNIGNITAENQAEIIGNISLSNTSSIDNISIGGNNTTLAGNITMLSNDNTSSIDNITISNGGTYAGTIHTAGRTNISGITIANGGVVGSSNASSMILSSGNST